MVTARQLTRPKTESQPSIEEAVKQWTIGRSVFKLFTGKSKPIEVEATPQGDEWMALCPNHNDTNPSLAVNPEKGVFYCHGCGFKGSLWDESKRGKPDEDDKGKDDKNSTPLGEPIAIYDYVASNGTLLFQVCKYPAPPPKNKTFKQRRLNPDFKEGDCEEKRWLWNLSGIPRVLYRLPELFAGQDPIFLCEGEKDVDNLCSLGLTATTNPMGAKKWNSIFNQCFSGREVVILPDNDDIGREHANEVAHNLFGVAKAVKIVELPDLPDKGDISDFLSSGRTKEELLRLVDGTPALTEKDVLGIDPGEKGLNLEYPQNAFRGFIKDFADIYSSRLESPYPFWIFNAATCLANIFSIRVRLNTSLFVEPRLYTICLGTSGTTRKSESGRQTINFFDDAMANYEGEGFDDKRNKLPSRYFNTLWGCGSAEGLMERLEKTPTLVLCYDELRSFAQKCDVKGSNLLPAVNTLFESNRLENATKDKYRKIENAHLSLLAFCTNETWETLFSPNFLDIGFINRLWIVPGKAEKKSFNPEAIPKHKKFWLMAKLNKLMENFPSDVVTTIEMDYDAEQRLQEWYLSFEQTEFTRRLDGYGLRLLLIMAISENKKVIDLDMAERCVGLLDWQRQVREAYQPADYTDVMSRIENLIRQAVKRQAGITKGRLLNAIHSSRFDSWKVNKALENIIKNGEIREIPFRETNKYVVNKKVD